MKKFFLNNWLFSEYGKQEEWLPATCPGTVHTDLLQNKLIDEPFANDNENKLSWIAETDWIYKTSFDFPIDYDDKKETILVFEGIDTIASVELNGKNILNSENMFLKYEVAVLRHLKIKDNELKIIFSSPLKYGKKQEKKYGKLQVALNSERVYLRKAQYSFGWDWGPSFPTSGLWRPVYLKQKETVEVTNVFFETLKLTNKTAEVKIKYDLQFLAKPKNLNAKITLSCKDFVYEFSEKINKTSIEHKTIIKNPTLWNPSGCGEQNLYTLEIELTDEENNVIDKLIKKVGIRTIALQLKQGNKNTFRFVVNGKPVFAKGTNWIPADTFLPRVSKEKYYNLLKAAKECNQNIVRVWGGGIYENDEFYEICDELGLLVWHDFMFACGSYPEHKEIVNNIQNEVEQNVSRLQHHPCIAMWCGNNENEWGWTQENSNSYKEMPGYKIYAQIIPDILKRIDSQKPYWESSPFGNDADPNSETSGNRHQWQIWSMWKDYREVVNDNSLFITEFGFQGPADISTFEKFITAENREIQSKIFEFHNKQVEGPERLMRFLCGHLPVNTNWEDFIYLAQLNQGFALKTCLDHWRSNYPVTNGSIIWQLNDCWPVTSWAIIDSELKPKLSYHFVKDAFSPISLIFISREEKLFVECHNQELADFTGALQLHKLDSKTGIVVDEYQIEITVKKDSKTKMHYCNLADLKEDEIIIATLYNTEGKKLLRNYFVKNEWKHLKLPEAKIKTDIVKRSKESMSIKVKSNKPVFFLDIYNPDLICNIRGIIMLANEETIIEVSILNKANIKKDNLKIFNLNNYLK